MTIYELYDHDIKQLSANDRLRLARLILDDLAPDESAAADQRVEDLVLESLGSGPGDHMTQAYKDDLRHEVRTFVTNQPGKRNA